MAAIVLVRPGAISSLAKELGLSRDALARQVGVSSSALYRLEAGVVAPSARTQAALLTLEGADVTFERLFEIVDR